MTKRNLGRGLQDLHEVEKVTLNQRPLQRELEDDIKGNGTHVPGAFHKTDSYFKKGHGRASPASVSSEVSDEEALISQSSMRSLSSASSWTDDGFEEEASYKVQQLFDAIESRLYEGQELPEECEDLDSECQDWIHLYHHLRITGSKYNSWQEPEIDFTAAANYTASSFDYIHDNERQVDVLPRNFSKLESGNCNNKLSLMVKGLTINPISSINECQRESEGSCPEFEEIIEQHGQYEELIAVNYNNDKSKCHSDPLSEMQLQDDLEIEFQHVMERIMKDVWNEVILCLRLALTKRIQSILHGSGSTIKQAKKSEENYLIDESPLPRLPTSQAANQASTNLHGLLTISSKTLLNRNADRSANRPAAHTSAPAAMVGTRLTTPQKLLHKNSGGRLAPIERLSKTASPASTTAHYENLKPTTPVINPISPAPWGRHFPLPPIDSGQQSTTSTPLIPAIRKVKPNSPAAQRMLSASIKRGGLTDPNRWKNSFTSTTLPITMTNLPYNRLYSAHVDSMQNYPTTFASIGERPKSNMRANGFSSDFRIQSASVNQRVSSSYRRQRTYGTQLSHDKARVSSGYSYNTSERRNNR